MRKETARLPGFWRFVWLFWMQPFKLHRLLRSVEVDPAEIGWKLLRRRRSSSENWWLVRSGQMLLLITPGVVLAVGLDAARGRHVNWLGAALGVALGVAIGRFLGVASGLFLDVAVGYGVVLGATHDVTLGAVALAVVGLAFGVTGPVTFGRFPDAESDRFHTVFAFFNGFFRIPVYLFEIICQMAVRYWNSMTGRKSLHWEIGGAHV